MKKILLLLLFASFTGQAQIVNIPDANFKARLLQANTTNIIAYNAAGVSMKIDTNNDGQIQVSEALNVRKLYLYEANISSLQGIDSFTNLTDFDCSYNPLTELDVSMLRNLKYLGAHGTQLVTLDCNDNINLEYLGIQSQTLKYLFIKNGKNENEYMNSGSWWELFCCNPNLEYVCCDDSQFAAVSNILAEFQITDCVVNSYCSFNPGGNYNTITGRSTFDSDNNGCTTSDLTYPFLKLKINDGTNQGYTITNGQGIYSFDTQAGNFTITPEVENPTYFNISPAAASINFTTVNNLVSSQDFCLSANGVHPDLEVVVTPVVPARPGFNAVYDLIYRNKGNQVMSQNYGLSFFYNQQLVNFVSADIAPDSQVPGGVNWSYSNLMPFESRRVRLTLNINAPTASNPVNIGDVLTFTGSILPSSGDANTSDNVFVFDQMVVGSYDPNDITCLQGNLVATSEIGKFLHYMIRFENTGNYLAENVVVLNEIDSQKYDVSSMQLLSSSHQMHTKLTNNKAEFIFENINLQPAAHGFVLLKIKSKSNLVSGNSVLKKASIFFDYNFPIVTNDAITTFQTLSIGENVLDASIKVYPNAATDFVTVKASTAIKSVTFFDVNGRAVQTDITEGSEVILNVSRFAQGIYFVKVSTEKGQNTIRLIKN